MLAGQMNEARLDLVAAIDEYNADSIDGNPYYNAKVVGDSHPVDELANMVLGNVSRAVDTLGDAPFILHQYEGDLIEVSIAEVTAAVRHNISQHKKAGQIYEAVDPFLNAINDMSTLLGRNNGERHSALWARADPDRQSGYVVGVCGYPEAAEIEINTGQGIETVPFGLEVNTDGLRDLEFFDDADDAEVDAEQKEIFWRVGAAINQMSSHLALTQLRVEYQKPFPAIIDQSDVRRLQLMYGDVVSYRGIGRVDENENVVQRDDETFGELKGGAFSTDAFHRGQGDGSTTAFIKPVIK